VSAAFDPPEQRAEVKQVWLEWIELALLERTVGATAAGRGRGATAAAATASTTTAAAGGRGKDRTRGR
jgi:hypothetical protein